MKIGVIKQFYSMHPLVYKIVNTGKILAVGKNIMGHDWGFYKLGHFLFTVSFYKGEANIERIAKSEKKLMASNNGITYS